MLLLRRDSLPEAENWLALPRTDLKSFAPLADAVRLVEAEDLDHGEERYAPSLPDRYLEKHSRDRRVAGSFLPDCLRPEALLARPGPPLAVHSCGHRGFVLWLGARTRDDSSQFCSGRLLLP